MNLIADVIDLIYPQFCASCKIRLSGERKACFCIQCWNSIKIIEPPYCKICGIPYPAAANDFICGKCINDSSGPIKIWRSIGVYEGTLREAIHQFKYRGKSKVGKNLCELTANTITANTEIQENLLKEVSYIIPVPLHKQKLREREYNQSEIIAKTVSEISNIPLWKNALLRTINTKPQSELDEKERWKNVSHAFSTDSSNYNMKETIVLLVDDIITTGATARSCAKVLLSSGASEVRMLSLSRGVIL